MVIPIRNIMQNIERILRLDLPDRQSAFLWRPRKTGKSTFLRAKSPNTIVYDFLETDLFFDFMTQWDILTVN
jgi:uncharacterized protein